MEISVNLVSEYESKTSRLDESIILEHVIRYLSKFDPLPVITIDIAGPVPVVVRGYKYVLAARALGRPRIRAAIEGKPSPEALDAFITRTGATLLDWESIQAFDERNPVLVGCHIFFFARPLLPEEKVAFDRSVWALFDSESIAVIHDDAGPFAEFEASTPLDHAFARRHLDAFAQFSDEHVRIVSYQGSRYGSP